jgi:hypothetical protein
MINTMLVMPSIRLYFILSISVSPITGELVLSPFIAKSFNSGAESRKLDKTLQESPHCFRSGRKSPACLAKTRSSTV